MEKELLKILENRFKKHLERHKGISWDKVREKLEKDPKKLKSLDEMEKTDGEPDVIGYDRNADKYIFCDCSQESPKGRRSVCYDEKALRGRKLFKPEGSALNMAKSMWIELLTEKEYRKLQEVGPFDTKSSSWIKTPDEIRALGGALFGDYRYGNTFVYHNGADSYYAGRGFRGIVRV